MPRFIRDTARERRKYVVTEFFPVWRCTVYLLDMHWVASFRHSPGNGYARSCLILLRRRSCDDRFIVLDLLWVRPDQREGAPKGFQQDGSAQIQRCTTWDVLVG